MSRIKIVYTYLDSKGRQQSNYANIVPADNVVALDQVVLEHGPALENVGTDALMAELRRRLDSVNP